MSDNQIECPEEEQNDGQGEGINPGPFTEPVEPPPFELDPDERDRVTERINGIIGRERIIYNSELYRQTFRSYLQTATPFKHYTDDLPGEWQTLPRTVGLDEFRRVVGAHYTEFQNEDGTFGQINYPNENGTILSLGANNIDLPFVLRQISEPVFNRQGGEDFMSDLRYTQTLTLRMKADHFAPRVLDDPTPQRILQNIQSYINGAAIGNLRRDGVTVILPSLFNFPPGEQVSLMYEDYHTTMQVPIFPNELASVTLRRPLIAEATSDYNFFIQPYEEKLNELIFTGGGWTKELPDLYAFEFERLYFNRDAARTILDRMITLDGRLNNENSSYFRDIIVGQGNIRIKVGERDKGDYFLDWSNTYERNLLDNFSGRFNNVIIDTSDMRFIGDINRKKYLYPMYNQLQFGTDTSAQLSDMLYLTDMTHPVLFALTNPAYAEDLQLPRSEFEDTFNFITKNYLSRDQYTVDHVINRDTEIFDLGQFLTFFRNQFPSLERILNDTEPDTPVVMYENPSFRRLLRNGAPLARIIAISVLSGTLKEIIRRNTRTFQDILNGVPAYSETIAYKIEKYRGNTTSEAALEQTTYVPNNSGIDIFEYIDTKVAYEQEYTYVVSACQIIVGVEYYYTKAIIGQQEHYAIPLYFTAQTTVSLAPKLKIAEVPYFTARAKVLDSAPLPPDVNIVPYRGIDDKVLFLFNAQVGEITEEPIIIEDRDRAYYEEYRRARNILGLPVTFEGDDEIESFEVYRTTDVPTSYSDFKGKLHEIVSTEPLGADYDSSAGAFVDDVVPNQKYYYTFRALDVHGNLSNPTAVFQVEMVNEDGAIFPLIETYNMQPIDSTQPSRVFKRFLYVKANELQSAVFEKATGNDNNPEFVIYEETTGPEDPVAQSASDVDVSVGQLENKVYGTETRPGRYKFRVTSKRTGRKIDINLNFIHKRINNL